MENREEHNCVTCVNGYFADFDLSGWHELCGAGHCYLCHMNRGDKCPNYKEGIPPDGKKLM